MLNNCLFKNLWGINKKKLYLNVLVKTIDPKLEATLNSMTNLLVQYFQPLDFKNAFSSLWSLWNIFSVSELAYMFLPFSTYKEQNPSHCLFFSTATEKALDSGSWKEEGIAVQRYVPAQWRRNLKLPGAQMGSRTESGSPWALDSPHAGELKCEGNNGKSASWIERPGKPLK